MMTSGTHCSNKVTVFLDGKQIQDFGSNGVVPFNWVWDKPQRIRLDAGEHVLRIYPWEDGLSFDQILISPAPVRGNSVLRSNAPDLPHGERTLFVVHDLNTCLLDPRELPEINIWIRRTAALTGRARLTTALELPGETMTLISREFSLSDLSPLVPIPIDLSRVPIDTLPRRECLLRTVLRVNGTVTCNTTTVLLKPLQWDVLGMLPFMEPGAPFPADGWAVEGSYTIGEATCTWQAFRNEWYDHFGVMDFGLMFAGNFLHAPEQRTVYARTCFRLAKNGEYLLKVLADDQMTLWIDGEVVARKERIWPVTRGSQRVKVRLSGGSHRMQFRLNQKSGPWQAAVFIRSSDDQLVDMVGEKDDP